MNNSNAILRALIVYAICIPLAIVVGVVAVSAVNSPTYSNFGAFGVLALILCTPILLRWHHPLLVLSWNLPLIIFFMPGRPGVFLLMAMLSLGISVLQRTTDKNKRFIPAPQITLPLACLVGVVLMTAKLTGGFGLRALGDPVMGGKKYVFLLMGILGYFALTARRIPPRQAGLYVALFFLGGCVNVVGDLIAFIPSSFYFIFLIFPPDLYAYTAGGEGAMRFAGVSQMATAVFSYMLARYGISGIFRAGKPWRVAAFMFFSALTLLGGFRSVMLDCTLLFALLFFLEGLHRTKMLPILLFIGLLTATICLPLSDRMPYSVQRVLSVLPVKVNPGARADAQGSLQWRIDMWKALLPEVPSHLLLGKGFAITPGDYELMGNNTAFHSIDPAQQSAAISGDYHSGPLSVILPLGIWGAIAFVWFLIAGVWALHRNRLHGDPALHTINTFLLAAFVVKIITFIFIFGSISSDVGSFAGLLGLGISLNGGIRRPARNPAPAAARAPGLLPERPQLQPAFLQR